MKNIKDITWKIGRFLFLNCWESTSNKAFLFVVLFLFFSISVKGQHRYNGGVQTEIKPSFSFDKGWKVNGKITTRTLLFEGIKGEPTQWNSVFERSELEAILTKQVSTNSGLGLGYLIRDEEGVFKQRIIQQFSTSRKYSSSKLGHRFRFDETFMKEESPIFRFRYRISYIHELGAKKKDDSKTYFSISNEYLPTLQNKKMELEMRIMPALGFKLNERNKLELGIDYRIEELFTASHKQLFLFNVAWLPSFN